MSTLKNCIVSVKAKAIDKVYVCDMERGTLFTDSAGDIAIKDRDGGYVNMVSGARHPRGVGPTRSAVPLPVGTIVTIEVIS